MYSSQVATPYGGRTYSAPQYVYVPEQHRFYSQPLYVQSERPRRRKCVLRIVAETAGWLLTAAACIAVSAIGGAVSCCYEVAFSEDEFKVDHQPTAQKQAKVYI